jgi:hypothetical protein
MKRGAFSFQGHVVAKHGIVHHAEIVHYAEMVRRSTSLVGRLPLPSLLLPLPLFMYLSKYLFAPQSLLPSDLSLSQ